MPASNRTSMAPNSANRRSVPEAVEYEQQAGGEANADAVAYEQTEDEAVTYEQAQVEAVTYEEQ